MSFSFIRSILLVTGTLVNGVRLTCTFSYSFLYRSSGANEENLTRNHNVFRCWAVSSFFSSLWLILFSGRIYSENVNWCWSPFTVQKVFLVITDWKQTHRRTFQVFQYYTKLQLKSKLPVGKNVKALSAFLNVKAVRKIQESWLKGSFCKGEKVTVSIMFG